MAVTHKMYVYAIAWAFSAGFDPLVQDMKVMLCTSGYSPNQATHLAKNQVTNEVTGTGYTARGKQMTTKWSEVPTGELYWYFDADDVVWANSTITARYAVIYRDTGVDSGSPLLSYVDFGEDKSSAGGDFKIEWAAGGIVKITVA